MSDYILIDYDVTPEDKDLTPKDIDPDFYISKPKSLREMFVDPGYELEMLTAGQQFFLNKLRERFIERLNEPISYPDLASAMHQIGNDNEQPIGQFRIIHYLRAMWRVGAIRRFIHTYRPSISRKKPGRGEWSGVHYILNPNKDIARS